MFYNVYGQKGVKNENWISEVLTLANVEEQEDEDGDRPKKHSSLVAHEETRYHKTKRLNAEAKQLKKKALANQEDYDMLLETLEKCNETLAILEKKLDVLQNDVVTIRAQNNFSNNPDAVFLATIVNYDHVRETVTVKYAEASTSNPVTAGRRSGATKDDGTKTFTLQDFKVSLSKPADVKAGIDVLLKPTSAWTGLYKVTIIEKNADTVKVQYEEKDRMVIDGKVDDGFKTFSSSDFYDLLAEELPVLADCLTTAAYAGGTAAYKGLRSVQSRV